MNMFSFSTTARRCILSAVTVIAFLITGTSAARNAMSSVKIPVGFIKNEGQVQGANGMPLGSILYTVHSDEGSYLFCKDKIMFMPLMKSVKGRSQTLHEKKQPAHKSVLLQTLFAGANNEVVVTGEDAGSAIFNYYTKAQKQPVSTKMYGQITYHDLYNGIDMVFYMKDGHCEYDFIVGAGADPSLIKMKFSGQESIGVTENGSLAVKYNGGEWIHNKPFCFQDTNNGARSTIGTRYQVSGSTVRFSLNNYDKTVPVTIDPIMAHTSYFGGTGDESIGKMKADASGNIFIAGLVGSTSSYPVTNPGGGAYYQATYVSSSYYDVYIAKFSSAGVLLWCTFYGDGDEANSFDMDVSASSGKIAVVGTTFTSSSAFPVLNPGGGAYYVSSSFGPQSGFISEFDNSGVLLWSTLVGPGGYGGLGSISYDPSGNIFVAACGNSTFPVVNPGGGAFQQTYTGTDILWLGKFNSSRALVWGTFYSGGGFGAYPTSMACDASGNVAVTGQSRTGAFLSYNPGGGAYAQSFGGGTLDAFIAKFSNAGVQLWSTYVGGSGDDNITGSGFDNSGNLLITGFTPSSDLPVMNAGGTSYYQASRGGAQDAFLQKYNSSGVMIHSTYFGTTGTTAFYGSQVNNNFLYLGGYTSGTVPVSNAFQATHGGGSNDAVVAKFDNQLALQWSSYFGGTGNEGAYCIATGSGNDIYFGGYTAGNLPLLNDGSAYYDASFNGATYDGFIAKMDASLKNGLSFDGTNDYVAVSGSAGIPSGNSPYTIEAWIKPTAGGVYGIAGWGNYGANNEVTAFRLTNATTLHHYWWFNDLPATVPNLVDGNWHHVVATYDGTTRAIYCDGALVASDVPSGHNVTVTNNVTVGRTFTAEYFPGSLDEVRIWNVGRTQSQIQANMNCDVSQQAGLVAYYRFNQGTASGTNTGLTGALDYSGNGNCGTLTNFALTGGSSNYVTGAIASCNAISGATPGSFSGNTPVCVGSSITLSNANTGGTWTTASGNITLNSTSGLVTGVTAGTATVNYTLNCNTSSVVVTINAVPAAITGNTTVSTAITTTLASATGSGTWTSVSTGVATIGSSTGVVTGVSGGTSLISYTLATGCAATTTVSVNTPTVGLHFDGTNDYIDIGNILPANNSYTKEAWVFAAASGSCNIISSGNHPLWIQGGVLRTQQGVLISDGISFPLGQWVHVASTYDAGTTTLRLYRNGNLVASSSSAGSYPSEIMNIGDYPSAHGNCFNGRIDEARVWNVARTQSQIQADMNCDVPQQANLVAYYRLEEGTAGGTNTGITCAFDYSGNNKSGTLSGFALTGGTSNYATGAVGNCNSISLPVPGSFSGNTPVCVGQTITLGNANTGGTWTTASGNITLNSTSGLVTGVTAGTATVNYTLNCSSSSVTVTINALPTVAAITGTTTLNLYNTTTLSDVTPSGVWSSAATGVATVGTSGVVTGISEGIAMISYTVTNGSGCIRAATTNVTVSGNNGLKLDGTNDYMITPNLYSAYPGTDVTVDLWFRANAAGVIVSELGQTTINSSWHDSWIEILGTGEVRVRVWSLSSVSLGTVSFGTWHHVAIRYKSSTNTLDGMLDGVVASSPVSGSRSINVGAFYLAFGPLDGTHLGSGAYLNGTIDEVRIWNRALCDGEIVNNMAGRLSGPQTGLVAYYTLDQGIASGTNTGLTTALDNSGNGNNATLNNIALTGSASNWITGTINTAAATYTAPTITASSNVTICNGTSTGLTVSGGTSYRWSPATSLSATTGSSVTANPSSTITYTVTDVCGGTSTVQVSVNAMPTVSGGSNVAICIGSSTGLTASGTATSFVWSPSASLSASTGASVTATPTVTTTYTVTGTNANGCVNRATVTVTVNPYSGVYAVTGGGPYCSGGAGSVIGLANSDVGINYQLYRGVSVSGSPVAGTGAAISFGPRPLAGSYTVVAVGAPSPGCTNNMSGSVSVSLLTSPAIVSMTGGGSVCSGGPGVPVGLSGSAVGIQYQLFLGGSPVGGPLGGVGTGLSFGLHTALGTYTATATNTVNACTSNMSGTAVINAAAGITAFALTGGGSYCSGGTGVAIGLAGSTSGISYQLFYGVSAVGTPVIGTGAAISFGLQTLAGSYTVVGTNTTTGCFGNMTGSAAVTIDPLPNIYTVTGGGAYCTGGTGVAIGLSLSQSGVDYQLYVGASATGSPVAGTGSAISFGLLTAAGTYTVTATNTTTSCANGMGGSVAVVVNPLPTVTTGAGSVICAGSPTGLAAGGATTYAWIPATALSATTGSSITASPTTTTTYTVTGTDVNGCVNTATVTLTVNALPTVSGGSNVAICTGSSTGLTASGASTYAWSPVTALSATTGASVTASPTVTTTYTVTGTDGNGCVNTAAVTVSVNPLPTVSAGSNVGICTGSSTALTASGAATYTWIPATALSATTGVSVTASPTVTTTYTVTGTDGNGCVNTATVMVTVNAIPVYSAGANVAICSGSSTSLTASEPKVGNALQFTGSGNNYINIPGTTDVKLNTSNFTVSVWINAGSTGHGLILYHGLGCANWSSWFLGIGGSENLTNAGKIVFGFRTSNGGGANEVASPGTVPLSTWVQVTGTYDGSNLRLYLNGSLVATQAASGIPYNNSDNLYVGQDPGCGGRIRFTGLVDQLQLWNTTRSGASIASDYNQHVPAATSGIIGSWSLDEASGSSIRDSSSAANHGTIVGSLTRQIPGTAPIFAPSSSSFTWSPSVGLSASTGTPVTASPTVTTTYTVTGTVSGCSNTATVTVSVNPLPTVSAGSNVTICAGLSTGLTASGAATYTWSPSTGLSATTGGSVTATPGSTTTYTVTGTDGNGCVNTATVMVSVNPLPVVSTGAGSVICAGTPTGLTASGASTYTWSPATALSASTGASVTASPTVTTTYTITGTSTAGCVNTAVVTLTVNPLPNNYAITGGGSFCSTTSGVAIGLAGSDAGVNYQLYTAGLPVGSPVAGTGAAISFGLHTISGVYTIVATNTTTGCTLNISGSTTITAYTSPAIVAVTGGGAYCSGGTGAAVGLAASATGVNYQLYLGASPVGSPVTGIGSSISFGLQTVAGTYTVVATNIISGCTANMSGSAVVSVHAALTTHTVTGGGSYCSGGTGVAVNLNGSTAGVNYQLYRGGLPLVGTIQAGTGAALSYGLQTTAGTYTVVATHATSGCIVNMAGSAVVTVNALPTTYTVTGGGSYCTGGTGVAVGLSNSAAGIDYQLYRGVTSVGSAVPGTGAAISFGLQTTAGTYTVVATNTVTACTANMTGSAAVTINALPTVYTVSGGGSYCSGPGLGILLSGSNAGVNYQLFNGASPVGSPVAGTGSGLNFGAFTTPGTYTVVATNATTSCTSNMTGSAVITGVSLPTAYTVTGGGTYCSGGTGFAVGLSNSDAGINYQLYRGVTTVGSAVAGTGSAISYGLQTAAGTYTVVATNATLGCTSTMTGSAVITINPPPATVTVTGGGSYCSGGTGVSIGLAASAVGIDYQLYNGASAVGSPVAGVGSSLSFGLLTAAGTYTVSATNTVTGCTGGMSGSATVSINALPTVFTVTGGGSYCSGGSGVALGLNGSQVGVNYQLFNGASPVGSPVSGSGIAITFGIHTAAGTYTVVATNASTTCANNMSGSATVTINALPALYAVTGTGAYCAGGSGVAIGLASSDAGINYQLYNGGLTVGSPVSGTGSALSFGTYTLATTYTVTATNASTGCTRAMSGSATITINSIPAAVAVTGGGTTCISGGIAVGLAASATGVNYQLYVGATPVGSPVAGAGTSLSFGLQTTAGTYTVIATHATTGCTNTMSGSAVISNYPVPTAFAVTGTGSYCTGGTGVAVGLAGSATGATYQLYRGVTAVGSPLAGTGSALSFGLQTTAGTYTVVATTTATGCTGNMTGSAVVTIDPLPTAFSVTGGGGYCTGGTGVLVGLSGSVVGTNYQLYSGVTPVGSPLAGTGAALSFGLQTTAGTYTVIATITATGCTGNMTGSAVVTINPLPTAYTVSGGGSYCSGPGIHVYLASSDIGVDYQLFNGASPVGSPVAGTGSSLDFGAFTAVGTYTVVATNTTTGCVNNMTGSAVISGASLPTVYSVTGGGSYCAGGTGVAVGVSNSAPGVDYQLFNGATPVGSPVSGTGAAISFGLITAAGTYTVVGTDVGLSCVSSMSGSAVVSVNALPTAYSVTGTGSYCSGGTGVAVGLSGSQSGVNYQLYNGVTPVGSAVAGSGAALSFGLQTTGGTYTVVATDGTTSCTNNMSGSAVVTVNSLPTVYTVTGGGVYCAGGAGHAIGLSSSQSGVSYQLYNGVTTSGSPVAGTGSAISFGLQTAAGTYTVVATNGSTACTSNMTGSATITVNPLPIDHAFSGGGTICAGGSAVAIGLTGSDAGVDYQLYRTTSTGTVSVGSAVSGTGSALSLGSHTLTGTYRVIATNTVTGCTRTLSDSTAIAVLFLPALLPVTGGGTYCAGGSGVSIGLPGSAIGTNYQLYRAGTPVGAPVAGAGTSITFGLQSVPGTYTVVATNATTGCTSTMIGSATVSIHSSLAVFSITGGGGYCTGGTGVTLGLSGSVSGVSYQLYRGGLPVVSTIVSGTGSAISFGLQTIAGTYTVVATNSSTGCTGNMSGSVAVSVNPLPTVYTVTGGGGYCTGGTGVAIGLSNSTSGVNYQLYRSTTAVGSPVAGTGSSISFGLQTTAGAYTVVATNATTGCTASMSGSVSVIINSLPAAFTVYGGGSYCSGGTGPNVYLAGTTGLTSYQLYLGGSPVGSPVTSGGGGINFGAQSAAGTYTVVATSTLTGCVSNMTGSATVSIIALPTAFAVTGGGGYCTGGSGVAVGLAGSATGVTYQLYRGASYVTALSGTGSALNFGLQTIAGTYTVTAFISGTACTSNMTGSAVVFVNSLPAAFTVTGGGSFCAGGSGVNVGLGSSVTGVNYQLYLGATPVGSPVAGTGTTLSFGLQATAGTYTVIATNTTSGCVRTMTGSVAVTINALPTVYTVTGGGSYCTGGAGVAIGLSGSQSVVRYQLYLGATPVGSPVTGTGGAISFGFKTTTGTYTVVATNISNVCTSNMTGSASVSVNALPAVYTVTGGGSYCSGGTGVAIGLSNTQSGVNYQLYRSTSAIGSAVAGTGGAITFGLQTVAGSYTVVATNATTGCTSNMSGSASISITSLPTICTVTGGGSYCGGGTGVAVGLAGSIGGVSYQLMLGGSPVGSPVTGIGAGFSFGLQTAAGVYTVVATNTTTGCSSTMSGSATVSILGPVAYTVTGGGGYCAGGTGVAIGLAGSATGVTYRLYRGVTLVAGPVSGTGSPLNFGLHTTAGTYTVTGTTTTTGCTGTMTGSAVVAVNPVPTISGSIYTLMPAATITLTGSLSGGTWTSGSTGVATVDGSTGDVTGVTLGTADITYTMPTGCLATRTVSVTATGFRQTPGENTTGMVTVLKGSNIQVLPNPNRGMFSIRGQLAANALQAGDEELSMEITNMLGQVVYRARITAKGGEIDEQVQLTEALPNAMYLLTLRSGAESKVFHMVIER